MNHKYLYFITALLFLFSTPLLAESNSIAPNSQFTNVIIFGDSLSDIGNFPESKYVYGFKDKKKFLFNIYIPISNPVVTATNRYQIPLTQIKQPYPKLNLAYLPQQPEINGQPRQYRSISWSQYFLSDAHPKLIASAQLIPWTALIKQQPTNIAKNHLSVSYAWAGALSTDNCHDVHYKVINDSLACTAASILQSNNNYRHHQNLKTWHEAQVPGTLKQIGLFKTDLQHQRVAVGPQTLYIIWVGGNDLANAYYSLSHTSIRVKLGAIKNIVYGAADNVYLAVKKLITNPTIQAKHIVVFNLFNLGLTPEAASGSTTEKFLAKYLTAYYNLTLSLMMDMMRHEHPNVSIKLANAHQWFADAAKNKQFKTTIGKMCQASSKAYMLPAGDTNNCKHYLFWNAAHPSTQAEQIIAYRLTKLLSKHN